MVIFGKTAETAAAFLVKGQVVLIEGRLQTRAFEQSGYERKVTEIIAEKVEFGQKPANAPAAAGKSRSAPEIAPEEVSRPVLIVFAELNE